MTVALSVKVFDGIVLATDSATTFDMPGSDYQVYNNANKIFHLHRKLPIAAMTWGLASIGPASISNLAKDLRRRLMGEEPGMADWAIDPAAYTVEGVAQRIVEHMFTELYQPQFTGTTTPPYLGLLVVGFSSGERQPESWLVEMKDPGQTPAPTARKPPDQVGWDAFGVPEAVSRLVNGYSISMGDALIKGGLDAAEVAKVMGVLGTGVLEAPLVQPAMPFADAVGVAEFLAETTARFMRYQPGADVVGGPIELAGITRHRGLQVDQPKALVSARAQPGGAACTLLTPHRVLEAVATYRRPHGQHRVSRVRAHSRPDLVAPLSTHKSGRPKLPDDAGRLMSCSCGWGPPARASDRGPPRTADASAAPQRP